MKNLHRVEQECRHLDLMSRRRLEGHRCGFRVVSEATTAPLSDD